MFKISLIAGFLGLGLLLWSLDFATSQTGFCTSCHVMKEFALSRQDSAHLQKADAGIRCVTCHLPRDPVRRIEEKVRSGIKDFKVNTTQGPISIEHFDNHHEHRKEFVYEESCIACHEQGLQSDHLLDGIADLHRHALSPQQGQMSCLDCHQGMEHGREQFFNLEKVVDTLSHKEGLDKETNDQMHTLIMKTCFACHFSQGQGYGNLDAFGYRPQPADYFILKVGIHTYNMPPSPFLQDYARKKMAILEQLIEGK